MAKDLRPASPGDQHPRFAAAFDRLLSVQRPVVLAHLRSIRSRHPDAGPERVIRILETRYLAAVTGGGAAVGASAAIPAVGVGTSLALSGVETAGFLEASALFAQSVAEVHGIAVDDPVRARTLVMTMMLGNGGTELVTQFASQAAGVGASRPAFWGDLITSALPAGVANQLADRVRDVFLKRFAASQGASIVGRAIPFGIGAVIGGTGNHLMGRRVVQSARTAFGPPPATFPAAIAPVVRTPRPPKDPSRRRAPRVLRLPRRATPPPDGLDRIWAADAHVPSTGQPPED
jgi:hypothetical protein